MKPLQASADFSSKKYRMVFYIRPTVAIDRSKREIRYHANVSKVYKVTDPGAVLVQPW
jgi:hypothetical protein